MTILKQMAKDKAFAKAAGILLVLVVLALLVAIAVFAGCALFIKWLAGVFSVTISFWTACGINLALTILCQVLEQYRPPGIRPH